MKQVHRETLLRILVACVWIFCIYVSYRWFKGHGITLRHLPRTLSVLIRSFGLWGPFILLAFHVLRTFVVFIPASVLSIVSGSLYGPFFGLVLNIIGDNLSAGLGFILGRFFGRRFVKEHENGWLKKYDAVLCEKGLYAVFFMRLLFFPFDVMNYGSGMTSISYGQYAIGTFFGMLPAIITLTVLGNAFMNPHAIFTFIVLLVLTVLLVFGIRRSKWVQIHILKNHCA